MTTVGNRQLGSRNYLIFYPIADLPIADCRMSPYFVRQ